MSTGLHQLWQAVERHPHWQQLEPEDKIRRLDAFVADMRAKHGHKVTGLQGFHNNVRARLADPKREESGFLSDTAKAFNEDFLRASQAKDGAFDDSFQNVLDSEYIAMVEAGGEEGFGVAGGIVGGFGHTLTKATAPTAIGFAAGGPPGAGVGFLGGSVVSDAPAQFAHSLRFNYFSQLDKGVDPATAWKKARASAGISGALTGAANLIPGGKFLSTAAKSVPGKGKVALGIKKALNAGTTTGGPARVAVDAVRHATDDVAIEALNVSQERYAFGIDASDYRGTLGERVAIAGAAGVALRGALAGVTKGTAGLKNLRQGKPFSDNLFTPENVQGLMGSLDNQILEAEHAVRQRPGEGFDNAEQIQRTRGEELRNLKAARDALVDTWDILTDGTRPADLEVLAKHGDKGQDAQFNPASNSISAFLGLFNWKGQAAKRHTLQHEAAHGHERTLPPAVKKVLERLYRAEMENKAGPLFDADGKIRKNLSDDLRTDDAELQFQEWYAERMALRNDAWAKAKLDDAEADRVEGFFARLAGDFRRKALAIGKRLGFGDQLDKSFRDFLDAGDKYAFPRETRDVNVRALLPEQVDAIFFNRGDLDEGLGKSVDRVRDAAVRQRAGIETDLSAAARTDVGDGPGIIDLARANQTVDNAPARRQSQGDTPLIGETAADRVARELLDPTQTSVPDSEFSGLQRSADIPTTRARAIAAAAAAQPRPTGGGGRYTPRPPGREAPGQLTFNRPGEEGHLNTVDDRAVPQAPRETSQPSRRVPTAQDLVEAAQRTADPSEFTKQGELDLGDNLAGQLATVTKKLDEVATKLSETLSPAKAGDRSAPQPQGNEAGPDATPAQPQRSLPEQLDDDLATISTDTRGSKKVVNQLEGAATKAGWAVETLEGGGKLMSDSLHEGALSSSVNIRTSSNGRRVVTRTDLGFGARDEKLGPWAAKQALITHEVTKNNVKQGGDTLYSRRGTSSVDDPLVIADRYEITPGQTLPTAPPRSAGISSEEQVALGDAGHTSFEAYAKQQSYRINAFAIRKWSIMRGFKSRSPAAIYKEFIRRVKDNLLHLHDSMDPELRERAKLWYEGANRIAQDYSQNFDMSLEQAAAQLAVLSPQKDWFMNVSLAGRVADIMRNQQKTSVSKDMSKMLVSDIALRTTKEQEDMSAAQVAADQRRKVREAKIWVKQYEGKTLADITDDHDRAVFVRLWDEAHNPRHYAVLTPEGNRIHPKTNADGSLAKVGWGSYAEINKAIRAMDADSVTIHELLGDQHKVRNFYNNIVDPTNPDHVTMDTHAIAAGLYLPLSGSSGEVANNFGASGAKLESHFKNSNAGGKEHGQQGFYAVFAEAYRQAAKERGLLAREMQSITWEQIRTLMSDSQKRQRARDAFAGEPGKPARPARIKPLPEARKVWQNTLDDETARKIIIEGFGGFGLPDWAVSSDGTGRVEGRSSHGREAFRALAQADDPAGVRGKAGRRDPVVEFPAAADVEQRVALARQGEGAVHDEFIRRGGQFSRRGKDHREPELRELDPNSELLTRNFADRASAVDPQLKAIRDRRPDIAFRDAQSVRDIQADHVNRSDAELDTSVENLKGRIEESEKNTAVLDAIERMKRAQDQGDAAKTEEVFDALSKAGTTIGQLLRQYREFKGIAATKHRLEIMKLALLKGGRRMTVGQEAQMKALIDTDAQRTVEANNAIDFALNNPTDRKAVAAAKRAQYQENIAFRKMVNEARAMMPRKFRQIPADLLAIVQGNLLTPVSTNRNAWGNYVSLLPRLAARIPAALVDTVRAKFSKSKERTVGLPSAREAAWFLGGTGRGLKKARDAFFLGATEDTILNEQIRGFNPVKSFVRAFQGQGGLPVDVDTGKVRVSDRVGKIFEGVFGFPAETMLRSLSALDELAKEGFRAQRSAEETKLKGIKPGTREFVEAELGVDKQLQDLADDQALQYTYQNASTLARAAQSVDNALAATPTLGPSLRFLFRVALSPYVRTPINLFVEGAKFAMPAFGFAHSAAKAIQASKESNPTARRIAIREAQLSASYATVGMILGAVAEQLVSEDLITGGPDDNKKTNLLRGTSGMGYFRINLSGYNRMRSGQDASYQPGDYTIRLDSMGVVGYVFAAKAEAARINEQDPTKAPSEIATKLGTDQLGNVVAMGRFAVNQTMLQGVSSMTQALERGSTAQWVGDKVNLLSSIAMPNTVMAWRATGDNEPKVDLNVPGDPAATAENILTYKFGDREMLLSKRDIFGKEIKATPAGRNPEWFHMVDHFKGEEVADTAANALYSIYRKTGDDRVIPSAVSRRVTHRGQTLTLTPELYDSLFETVQGAKGEAFVRAASSSGWQRIAAQNPGRAVDILASRYERAGQIAKKRWQQKHRAELGELDAALQAYLQTR